MNELLTLNHFNVKWLKNGVEALHYLKSNVPDIIISDLMMPLMDGEQLFLNLKKLKTLNVVPFIIITANLDDTIQLRQLEHGVTDFIRKPFKTVEFLLKIQNLIALKQNIINKYKPDPFSKITIKLSEKDFMSSVNEIVLKNIKSKVDVNELASQLFISKSTLDKKTRKYANCNISQYIRELKLDFAVKMMDLGERNFQFLADETGFNSLSYFSTSFKQYKGITPRDYVKNISK
jgi:YesN/AraC family two-component response regulator